jgi:hypothetical protein
MSVPYKLCMVSWQVSGGRLYYNISPAIIRAHLYVRCSHCMGCDNLLRLRILATHVARTIARPRLWYEASADQVVEMNRGIGVD